MKLQVLLLGVLCLRYTDGQTATVSCQATSNAAVFDVVFKYDIGSLTTITGLKSYDANDLATEISGTGCENATSDGSIFTVQYTVDTTASLPCGVKFDGGSKYSGAISPVGNNKIHTFVCDLSNLGLAASSVSTFDAGHNQNKIAFAGGPITARFDAVKGGTYIPVSELTVGDYMSLVVTYNDGKFPSDKHPNMFGYSFHIAPMLRKSGYLDFYTPGLPTIVTVTGQLPGNPFSETFVVHRDQPKRLTIPAAYWPDVYNANAWTKKSNVILVKSTDRIIAAKLTQNDRSVLLFPDTYLSTEYRMVGQAATNTISIVGTEDDTNVTFTLAGNFASLMIDGTSATDGMVVNINAMETIQVHCDISSCINNRISSNKDVGVVVGGSLQAGSSLTASDLVQQLPAKKYLDTNFVAFPGVMLSEGYTVVSHSVGSTTITTDTTVTFTSTQSVPVSGTSQRVSSTNPVYLFAQLATNTEPFNEKTYIPSVRQWSERNLFFLTKEYKYELFIVAFKTADNSIEVQTPSTPATVLSVGYLDVSPLSSAAPDAQYVSAKISPYTVTETGMYEFRSSKPFLIIVRETKNGAPSNLHSLGMRLTCINPCVKSTSLYAPKGNGMDDDCDGFVDEDVVDGQDGEFVPDSNIDEDPPLEDNAALIKVKVNQLYAARSADFSDGVLVIDNDVLRLRTFAFKRERITDSPLYQSRCPSSTSSGLRGVISSFAPLETLNNELTDLLVLGTPQFRAFRFSQSPTQKLYLRVVLELCHTEIGSKFCPATPTCTSRKKRSADVHQLTTVLTVRDTATVKEPIRRECESTRIYWMPHFLLAAIICVEASATGYFLFKKSKLKTL